LEYRQLEGIAVGEWERLLPLIEEHLGSQFLLLAVALVVEALDLILVALFVVARGTSYEFVHRDDQIVGQRRELQASAVRDFVIVGIGMKGLGQGVRCSGHGEGRGHRIPRSPVAVDHPVDVEFFDRRHLRAHCRMRPA